MHSVIHVACIQDIQKNMRGLGAIIVSFLSGSCKDHAIPQRSGSVSGRGDRGKRMILKSLISWMFSQLEDTRDVLFLLYRTERFH